MNYEQLKQIEKTNPEIQPFLKKLASLEHDKSGDIPKRRKQIRSIIYRMIYSKNK